MKTRDEIEGRLRGAIVDAHPRSGEIPRSARLIEDLGLDSLDYATVLLTCEEWLGVRVVEDHVDWQRIGTVEGLAEFLYEQQADPAGAALEQ